MNLNNMVTKIINGNYKIKLNFFIRNQILKVINYIWMNLWDEGNSMVILYSLEYTVLEVRIFNFYKDDEFNAGVFG